MSESEQHVRDRAYQLWQRAGCPANRSDEFWFAAQRETAGEAPLAGAPGALQEMRTELSHQAVAGKASDVTKTQRTGGGPVRRPATTKDAAPPAQSGKRRSGTRPRTPRVPE